MILVRHGQSEWNLAYEETGEDPGIRDAPLTARGRRQAAATAARLSARRGELRRIISSPLTRALQTARILARALDLSIRVEPLVVEQACFSCDQGTPRSELARRWPDLDFAHLDEEWWGPLRETEEEMLGRVRGFRARMADLDEWPRIVVVSHWAFIKGLTGEDTPNAGIVRFDPRAPLPDDGAPFGAPAGDL